MTFLLNTLSETKICNFHPNAKRRVSPTVTFIWESSHGGACHSRFNAVFFPLPSFSSVRYGLLTHLLLLSGIFKKWRHQKRQVDAENEKVFRAQAILARNHKARVLQGWRVVNQEQQIISPMVARRERKEMAR